MLLFLLVAIELSMQVECEDQVLSLVVGSEGKLSVIRINDDLKVWKVLGRFPIKVLPEVQELFHLMIRIRTIVKNTTFNNNKSGKSPSASSTALNPKIPPT